MAFLRTPFYKRFSAKLILVSLGFVISWGMFTGRASALVSGWSDVAGAMTVDGSGNVYVTGWSWSFGGSTDIATLKYGPDGTLLWEQRLGNGYSNRGNAVAVDSGGNVYVAGKAYSPSTSSDDYIVVKYTPDGTLAWKRSYDGPGHGADEARAIGLDASGNVYVTGSSYGGASTGNDYATIKYSPLGRQLWVSRFNGGQNGDDDAYAIAVSADGYAHVTGSSYGASYSGGDLKLVGQDYLTVKYDPSGKQLWASTFNYNWGGFQQGASIALDSEGNVFITGPNWHWLSPDNGPAFTVIKYQAVDGRMLWSCDYNGPGNDWDEGIALVVDTAGAVYATGKSYGNTATGYNAFDFVTIKYSSSGVQRWVSRYNGPGNGEDDAAAIALDTQGNVLVTGQSWASGKYMDIATVKYRGTDGKELWVQRFGLAAGWDSPVSVAVDAKNNVYVAGNSVSNSTGNDYVALKYGTGGKELWVERYAGLESTSDSAAGLALDGKGNVYVTGTSYRACSAQDYATVAYSPTGRKLWAVRYNGPNNGCDEPAGIGTDSSGNIYVAGTSATSESNPWDYAAVKYRAADGVRLWARRLTLPNSQFELANAVTVNADGSVAVTGWWIKPDVSGLLNFLTVKYSAAGELLWNRSYDGPAKRADYPYAVAMDAQGKVYVAGMSENSAYDDDYAIIKYDDGGMLWAKTYNGPAKGEDWAQAVTVDGKGNIYVTGCSESTNSQDVVTIKYNAAGSRLWVNRHSVSGEIDTAGAITLDKDGNICITGDSYTDAGGTDYLTIKLDAAGKELWAKRYNGPGNGDDSALAVTADKDGNIYVTGRSMGTGSSDYATVKYSPAGTELWVKRYDGPGKGWDGAVALALDKLGNLYVTGTSYGGKATGYDYATVKYQAGNGKQLWVQRYDGK